tara:strand:- start:14 stop:373 length:360 start_codon:yes stop_codon:yes gene_type:complete
MNFQRKVLLVSSILFILTGIFIIYVIYNDKFSKVFPPVVASCPDYWLDQQIQDSMGNQKSKCVNVKKLGTCPEQSSKSFDEPQWLGPSGECRKSKWAKQCNLTWDGITNNSKVCDNDAT